MKNFLVSTVQLTRADRPVGTVLLACPMLWALWLASPNGNPPAIFVFIFIVGAFVMRSAGCVINDYADIDIDNKVKRTKDRPLTTGKIKKSHALMIFVMLIFFAISLLLFLPKAAIFPAFFAFFLAVLYPFTKRFFIIPQLVLGLAFSTAILMAFSTILGAVTLTAILLFVASTLWTVVYDTFYAMVDRDDDKDLGIYSSALFFSDKDLKVCFILVCCFVALMIVIGVLEQLGIYYYLGLTMACCCFGFQFWLARLRERDNCFRAFLNNQWVGILIFLGILLDSLP
ncbi:MAG: 4-hydroxybenzoate octaprenyltransferase [Gammaproteobacteria bacterium]|nr:4-hydroxybenzoate octaprenyltransferase [Gammaproteobacteria bacterium]